MSFDAHAALWLQLRSLKRPLQAEYRFAPGRRYRSDFVLTADKILIELDGGVWLPKGGHTSGVGKTRDCRKDLLAWTLGWTTIRVTPEMVKSGEVLAALEERLGRGRR